MKWGEIHDSYNVFIVINPIKNKIHLFMAFQTVSFAILLAYVYDGAT